MKPGFYAIAQAGGDQDPRDDEAYSTGVLAHFSDGRFVAFTDDMISTLGVDGGRADAPDMGRTGPLDLVMFVPYEMTVTPAD